MKVHLSLFLGFLSSTLVEAGKNNGKSPGKSPTPTAPAPVQAPVATPGESTCTDQSKCISWTMNELASSNCGLGANSCTVEVCLLVAGGGACGKGAGESFSHMCHQSNSSGCPVFLADGVTPVMGAGSETSCSSVSSKTGQGNTAAFDGKCETGADMLMCQEGEPGQTLYWIVKDGQEDTVEDKTFDFQANGCTNSVRCFNNEYYCGNASAQIKMERTWAFTIPDGTGSCPSVCSTPDPTSSPTSGPSLAPQPDPTPYPTSGPTSGPSQAPQPAPVAPPVPAPVTPPVAPPVTEVPPPPPPTPEVVTDNAGSQGDPHFRTWHNEHFEYHGQCDLVLAKDAGFADGLGIDVQIRTKLVRFWSYIKNAAIRIGNDVFEVEGNANAEGAEIKYWFNMESMADLSTIGGFPITIHPSNQGTKQIVDIDLSSKYPGSKIEIQIWKEFVKVNFVNPTQEAFGNCVGMLGDFESGKTFGRDRATEITDFYKLGNEWQVLPTDLMLFHKTEQPQFPSKCIEPEDPRGERRRRLDESSVSVQDAEQACAALTDDLDRKDCVYDIVATQDMDMAGAY